MHFCKNINAVFGKLETRCFRCTSDEDVIKLNGAVPTIGIVSLSKKDN
jgi:hypothetical protein